MTPFELKQARRALGLSAERFARVVGVESGRTVRRWEKGERDIPGPVLILLAFMLRSPGNARLVARLAEEVWSGRDGGGHQTPG